MGQESTISKTYKTAKPAMFFTQPMLRDFNWMLRLLRGARGQNGITVRTSSGHLEVGGLGFASSASAPRSFGYTLTQPVEDPAADGYVTVAPGWVWHHGWDVIAEESGTIRAAWAEDDVTVTAAGYTVIYVQYTLGSETLAMGTANHATTEAGALALVEDSETVMAIPLLCVNLASGALSVVREYHVGTNIHITALLGA